MVGAVISLNLRLAWQGMIRQWWRIILGIFGFLFMGLYLFLFSVMFLFAGSSEGADDYLLLATLGFPGIVFFFHAAITLMMGLGNNAVSPRQLAVFVSPRRKISLGLLFSVFITPLWLSILLFVLAPGWFYLSRFGLLEMSIYVIVMLLAHATLGIYLHMWRIREQARATVRSTSKKQAITSVTVIIGIALIVALLQFSNTFYDGSVNVSELIATINAWSDSLLGQGFLMILGIIPGLAPLVALYAFFHGSFLLFTVASLLSLVGLALGIRVWFPCVDNAMLEKTSKSVLPNDMLISPESIQEFALSSAQSSSSAGLTRSHSQRKNLSAEGENLGWGYRIIFGSKLSRFLGLSRGGSAILGVKLLYAKRDPRLILQLVMPLYCSIIFGAMILAKDQEAFFYQEMFLVVTPIVSGMILLNLWAITSSAIWYQFLAPVSPWEERHSWVVLFLPVSFLMQLVGYVLANWFGEINFFDLLFLFGNTLFSLALFAFISIFIPLPGAAPGENVFRNNFGKGSYALLAMFAPTAVIISVGAAVGIFRTVFRMFFSANLAGVAMLVLAILTYPLFMYLCQVALRKRSIALIQRILTWPGHKYTN